MHWLFRVPEKPHFGPIQGHSCHKNLKNPRFFSKIFYQLNVTLCKKKKKKSKKRKKIKSDNFSYNLKQLLCLKQFWAHFGHFWPKNLKTRSFPTTQDCVAVTLCKKNQKNYMRWFFTKLEKLHFGSLLAQNL